MARLPLQVDSVQALAGVDACRGGSIAQARRAFLVCLAFWQCRSPPEWSRGDLTGDLRHNRSPGSGLQRAKTAEGIELHPPADFEAMQRAMRVLSQPKKHA